MGLPLGGDVMPSTTVHIPEQLLLKIDRVTKERKISRNRFIIQACEQALVNDSGKWPEGFFETDLTEADMQALKEGASEMEEAIISRRKNRRDVEI